jgi:hypothetical protein
MSGSTADIIGHSFGGLVTQILLDHGLGAAGAAIDSAPVKGIKKPPIFTIAGSLNNANFCIRHMVDRRNRPRR